MAGNQPSRWWLWCTITSWYSSQIVVIFKHKMMMMTIWQLTVSWWSKVLLFWKRAKELISDKNNRVRIIFVAGAKKHLKNENNGGVITVFVAGAQRRAAGTVAEVESGPGLVLSHNNQQFYQIFLLLLQIFPGRSCRGGSVCYWTICLSIMQQEYKPICLSIMQQEYKPISIKLTCLFQHCNYWHQIVTIYIPLIFCLLI